MEKSSDCLKEVAATFGSEALKEVPAGEAFQACNYFDYFICNILDVICN